MKKILFLALLLFFLEACQEKETKPENSIDFSEADNLLQNSVGLFDGKVIVLVKKDGQLIYEKSIGNLDRNTAIPVASCSKWVSGAVILSLADKELINLDEKIGTYLPIFHTYGKGNITVRQCFSITSGFQECSTLNDPSCFAGNQSLTLAQAVNKIAEEQPILFQAGTKVNYGNVGMHITGRIAEVVTGKNWEVIFAEQIASKCSMPKSNYGNLPNPIIAGGLRSTPDEYMNFLEMVLNRGKLNGIQVLSQAMIEEFFKDQTKGASIFYIPYPLNPPFHPYSAAVVRYGFGEWLDVVNPTTGVVEQISSPGAFGTYPWVDRKRNLSGIIFTFKSEGFQSAVNTELQLIDLIRKAVDKSNQ